LSRDTADVIRFSGGEYFAVQRGTSAVLVGAPRSVAEAEDTAETLSRLGVRRLEWILLLDSSGVDAPMLRLAQTFSCGRIAAPDESETRAFAYSSGLALTALKDGEFTAWDAVGVKIDSGAVTFSFDAGQALKSEGKCVIMGKTAPLTPVGNADLRCRFAAKGQA
jgi:adenylate kinase family enzyme